MKKNIKIINIMFLLYILVILASVCYYIIFPIYTSPTVYVKNAVTEEFYGSMEFNTKIVKIENNTVFAEVSLSNEEYKYKEYKLFVGDDTTVKYNNKLITGKISSIIRAETGTDITVSFFTEDKVSVGEHIEVFDEKPKRIFSNVVDSSAVYYERNGIPYVYIVKKERAPFGEAFYLYKINLAYVAQIGDRCALILRDIEETLINYPIVIDIIDESIIDENIMDKSLIKDGIQVNLAYSED